MAVPKAHDPSLEMMAEGIRVKATRSRRNDLRMMAAACMAIFIWGSIDSLLGAILPDLVRRANLTNSLAADVSLLNGAGLVFASMSVGPLLDRRGRKPVFVAALLLIGSALFGLHWADRFALIAGLAFLLGVGGSALVTAAQALVSELHNSGRVAALNLLNFFFGLGAFVTPLARGPLDKFGAGMSGILWSLAGICLLVALFDVSLPFPPSAPADSLKPRESFLRDPLFWVPVSIVFFYVGIETSIWFWQVVYWNRILGTPEGAARLGVSLFAIAIMTGRIASRWVIRFLSPRGLLVWGTSGSLVGLLGMRLADHYVASVISLVAAGLFMAVVFPTSLGAVGTRFAGASGTPLGLAVTAGWLGAMTIRPMIGYMGAGDDLARGYWMLIAVALLMCACGVILFTVSGAVLCKEEAHDDVLSPIE